MERPEDAELDFGPEPPTSKAMEDALVDQLTSEGLLRRSPRTPRPFRHLYAAAAAGFFFAGVAAGQWMEGRQSAQVVAAALQTEALSQAIEIQRAGSEYVRAVAELTQLVEAGQTDAVHPGREAASVALHAATIELARLSPDDPSLRQILNILDADAAPPNSDPRGTP